IRLRIESPLGRQVLALLARLGITDDHQPCVRLLLHTQCDVVENGLASIIPTPRLLLIREVALAQFASLWRRWWRIFDRHLGRGIRRQSAGITASRAYCDDSRRCPCCVQCPDVAAAGN